MELDTKKFLIQIIVAITISIVAQFLSPLVNGYVHFYEKLWITSLSLWFFSFSITFFIYPDNKIVNNYLFCSLFPLTIIYILEIIVFSAFFDFLHILPIIVNVIILIIKRETIDIKYILPTLLILVIWATIVRLLLVNYVIVPLLPEGLIIIIAWPIATIVLGWIITWINRRKGRIKKELVIKTF